MREAQERNLGEGEGRCDSTFHRELRDSIRATAYLAKLHIRSIKETQKYTIILLRLLTATFLREQRPKPLPPPHSSHRPLLQNLSPRPLGPHPLQNLVLLDPSVLGPGSDFLRIFREGRDESSAKIQDEKKGKSRQSLNKKRRPDKALEAIEREGRRDSPSNMNVELVSSLGEIRDSIEGHGKKGNLEALRGGDGDGEIVNGFDLRSSKTLDGCDEAFGSREEDLDKAGQKRST